MSRHCRPFVALLLAALAVSPSEAARRALVLDGGGIEAVAGNQIQSILIGHGFDVDRGSSLPSDLGVYCCIWDARAQNALSPADRGAYLGFLRQGHGVVMLGENSSCCTARNESIEAWINDDLGGGTIDISTTFEWLGATPHDAVGGHDITAGVGLVTYDGFGNGAFQNLGLLGRSLTFRNPPGLPSAAVWDQGKLTNASAGRLVVVLDVNWLIETYSQTDNALFADNMAGFTCPVTEESLIVDITDPSGFTRQCPDTISVFGQVIGTDTDCAQPTRLSSPTLAIAATDAPSAAARRGHGHDGPPGWISPARPRADARAPAPRSILAPNVVAIDVSLDGATFFPVTATSPSLPAPTTVTFSALGLPLTVGSNTIVVRATNDQGVQAFDSVTGSLIDTNNPSIGPCPANRTVDLGAGCMLSFNEVPPASDTCDPVVTVSASPPLPFTFDGPDTQTFTYTAIDDAGNTATCTTDITVRDIGGPTIGCPVPLTLECVATGGRPVDDPDVQTWLESATISDNCDPSPTLVDDRPTLFPAGCPPGLATTVTWIGEDESMNTASCGSALSVQDTTPPDITSTPGPLGLLCNSPGGVATTDPVVQDWLAQFAADDLCFPGATLTNDAPDVLPVTCTSAPTEVTFTATDDCGNPANFTQEVTVTDPDPPTLTVPAAIALECSTTGGVPSSDPSVQTWLAGAAAADICSDATLIDDLPALIPSSCSGRTTTVTFTASDECGNATVLSSSITVTDSSAPELSVPPPLELECNTAGGIPIDDAAVQAWLTSATANDVCGSVTLSNDAPQAVPLACGGGVTIVTFTAVDSCGQITALTSTITVVDTTPPTLTVPAPLTVECNTQGGIAMTDATVAAWLQSATTSDICGSASVVTDAPALLPAACGSGATTTVTFTATDDCGNATALTSTITVVDTTAPTLSVPPPLDLECSGPAGVPVDDAAVQSWLAQASSDDICGAATVTDDAPQTFGSACGGQVTPVDFTATDGCGLETTLSSTVTVRDTMPPTLDVPADLVLECDGTGGIAGDDPRITDWLASATASDACASVVDVANDAPAFFTVACGTGSVTVVTFTAVDDCGHSVTRTATVTVRDTTGPTLVVPAPLELECNADGGVARDDAAVQDWLQTVTADDLCSSVSIVDDAPPLIAAGCAPGAATIVTFTATDDCGNETEVSGTITVVDTTPPTASAPDELILECNRPGGVSRDDPQVQSWLQSATADDVCNDVSLLNDAPEIFPSGCGNGAQTTVIFTATDTCNNATDVTSSVTVSDTTPPTLSVPPTLTIECNSPGGVLASDPRVQAWLASATADDVCGAATLSNDLPAFIAAGCEPGAVTTVTFTAVDSCGLETALTSNIVVRDTTPPTVTPPLPLALECMTAGGVPITDPVIQSWLGTVTANDICHDAVIANDAPDFFASGCTPGAETIVTFTATDDCGNASALPSSVTIVDTTAPDVSGLLRPLAPASPQSPTSPRSVCSAPSSRRFVVECAADDVCSQDIELVAKLIVTGYDVPTTGQCVPEVVEVPVSCGNIVEIHLLAPPCDAQSPTSARPSVSADSAGVPIVTGVEVILEVTATDDCGNGATATYDPTQEPSPSCDETPPHDILIDGTCCPAVARPPGPPCSGTPCGAAPDPFADSP